MADRWRQRRWFWHVLGALLSSVVTLLVLTTTAHCADLRTPVLVYGASVSADYLSTRYALSRGARELNPLARNLEPAKAAQFALLVGLDVALQKGGHKGKAKALRITAAVIGGSLAAWNLHTARRQR